MDILVCVKRVPMVGGTIVVTPDGQDLVTRMSGFTVSPHEECAVEEAVRIVERLGGSVTVLTLGPPEAADQLRDMLALGAGHALLLETGGQGTGGRGTDGQGTDGREADGREWGPIATAAAIADAARRRGEGPDGGYDLLETGGQGTGGRGTDGQGTGGREADGREADGREADGREADGREADGREWGPIATAAAIADAARRRGEGPDGGYDLLLFGNEAADTGDFQVAVRVAYALGLPCVTGIKNLEISVGGDDGAVGGAGAVGDAGAMRDAGGGGGARARARREYRGVEEIFDVALPAVVSVKEGINLPRYPSLPGRLRAKRAVIERFAPEWHGEGLRKERLRVPEGEQKRAQILGTGPDAVPALVRLLDELGVLS